MGAMKIGSGLLVVTMAVGLLTACGRGQAPNVMNTVSNNTVSNTQGTDAGAVNVEDEAQTAGFEVLAEKLETPWAIDFIGDTIYISERAGKIVKVDSGKQTRQNVKLSKAVRAGGEGGLLGFALAPDFQTSKQAYVYHTYEENGKLYNRIVLIREDDQGTGWSEMRELLGSIPGAQNHNGGRLLLGPDGMLYATTGDAQEEASSQDRSALAGKILRLKPDGSIPADNPLPDSYVYSYGHRNPQGLAWSKAGQLYSSEHGPSGAPGGHDELNIIQAGSNYGWPDIIGDEKKEGMVTPLYHTGESTLAPSGIAIADNGDILVTGLRGQSLVRFSPDASKQETLVTSEGRLRDVKIKDGAIYVITNNTDGRGEPGNTDDRLLRLK